VRFAIMGPLTVHDGDEVVPVASGKLRVLLAALLCHANRVVSYEQLADLLWDGRPSEAANTTIRSYVKRLRRALGAAGGRIESRSPGYLIRVEPGELDTQEFADLCRAAEQDARREEWARCVRRVEQALALWRQSPLVDVPSPRLQAEESRWLTELRVEALERQMQAAVQLRRYEWAVAQLEQLVREYPLRERLHHHLIVALDGLGRRTDALLAYQRVRQILDDELGIDPGPELQALHQRILAAQNTPASPRTAPPPAGTGRAAVPRQLPSAIRHFVGRQAELDELTELLDTATRTGTPAPVLAVSGAPGVGKTALAVHWGHQVAHRFPDGQLYLDLCGFHPSRTALTPDDAIRDLLSSFLPNDARLPSSPSARAALYRSIVADKTLLIVLDNAYDAEQVRPLLPGGLRCLTIVTSRNRLNGLVAREGAHPVLLGVLPEADAYGLLVRRLGRSRLEREPAAARQIVDLCHRLPLALSVVAARGATSPQLSLTELADEMAGTDSTLDRFRTDPGSPDVRAIFSWSYRQLTDSAARMFRFLGLYPATSISTTVAASLAGQPLDTAQAALRELASAHLLAEQGRDRFTCHDLMRSYAGEQAAQESPEATEAALRRLLDHYLYTAHRAAELLEPIRQPLSLGPPEPGTHLTPLADHRQARAWFRAEISLLLTLVRMADKKRYDRHCWRLAWTLVDYLHSEGRHEDLLETQRIALAAARRSDDLDGEARVHREVSRANQLFERLEGDCPHLIRALHLYQQINDTQGQGRTYLSLAYLCARQGRYPDARDYSRRALEFAKQSGDQGGYAAALNSLGWCQAELGNLDEALRHCQESLDLHRRLGMRAGEAYSYDSLGYIHSALGDLDSAVVCYRLSVELWRALGNRLEEAMGLRRLAEALTRYGYTGPGRVVDRLAERILLDMGQIGHHLP
jgi:DNA-binding SARP family transcriptional activator